MCSIIKGDVDITSLCILFLSMTDLSADVADITPIDPTNDVLFA